MQVLLWHLHAKSIRDQIIEGLHDGDTMEDLLKESEITLATIVAKCRSKEVAKKNWSQMIVQEQGTEMVAKYRDPQPGVQQRKFHTCLRYGGAQHKGGCIHCPVYDKFCSCCQKVGHFTRVCRSRQRPHQQVPLNDSSQPAGNTIHLQSLQGDHI